MINIRAVFSVADIPVGAPLARLFPTVAQTVAEYSDLHHRMWLSYALNGVPLPESRRVMPILAQYAGSIQVAQAGPFHWTCSTNLPEAKTIEEGKPAFDMKQYLRTSLKTRVSAAGKRYLIIPFRHGTPGSSGFSSVMPAHVHRAAKLLEPSRITSSLEEPNHLGVHDIASRQLLTVSRFGYKWGGRLGSGMVLKRKDHHKTDRFSGMVRFDAPQGGQSHYMTFRVMHQDSTGWIKPAVPGYWVNKQIATLLQRTFHASITAAADADYAAWLRQAGL